jgi:hypothetical protein
MLPLAAIAAALASLSRRLFSFFRRVLAKFASLFLNIYYTIQTPELASILINTV